MLDPHFSGAIAVEGEKRASAVWPIRPMSFVNVVSVIFSWNLSQLVLTFEFYLSIKDLDPTWGPWSNFTINCTSTCGRDAVASRYRVCIYPDPSQTNGIPCRY